MSLLPRLVLILLRLVTYLVEENRILRSKAPQRIMLTPRERNRLVKLGKPLGLAIKDVITIVSPRTFARWARGKARKPLVFKCGRRPTAEEIRELILKLARENGWGYTRILGELRKLGAGTVCRSTVVNILKDKPSHPRQRHQVLWGVRRYVGRFRDRDSADAVALAEY